MYSIHSLPISLYKATIHCASLHKQTTSASLISKTLRCSEELIQHQSGSYEPKQIFQHSGLLFIVLYSVLTPF